MAVITGLAKICGTIFVEVICGIQFVFDFKNFLN